MNKHSTFVLDDHSVDLIDRLVGEAGYDSPSAVVRAGLELLEQRQAQIEKLRAAIIEGEQSGEPQPFDLDAFIARKHRERGL